jgi:hypothetical protein
VSEFGLLHKFPQIVIDSVLRALDYHWIGWSYNKVSVVDSYVSRTIMYSGVEMVELLLSKGANPDSLNHGGTALHLAAIHGQDDILKVLLDHHADVRATPVFSFL